MHCAMVTSEPIATLHSGVLAINVVVGRDEALRLDVENTAAARCIEKEDSLCWSERDGEYVYWSNRSRTVRDVPLRMVVPPAPLST